MGKSQAGRTGGADGGGAARTWFSYHTNPNGDFAKNSEGELAFVPRRLPPNLDFDGGLLHLLIRAERGVAELKGIAAFVPNPRMLARACIKREAVLSSRIEGTGATAGDLDRHEAIGGAINPAADARRLQEVVNCAEALDAALARAGQGGRGLGLDVLLRAHETLARNVRGGAMGPGRLREAQNYIVRYSGGRRQVSYVPPPHESVRPMLEDILGFLRSAPCRDMSGLVQCALVHYQFEAVHPFLDGNGRVGRLLVPLVLRSTGLLPDPLLCMSAYFERHRDEYYARLRGVSQRMEWREWLRFFLEGVAGQAAESIAAINKLERTMAECGRMLAGQKAGANARLLLPSLVANPYTTVPLAGRVLDRSYPAARKAVDDLVRAGILRQAEAGYRGRLFHAEAIGGILGGD